MQGDALGLEQALVRGVADQCVLEEIGRVRRRAAAKDQFGIDQLTHRVGELALRESSERGDGAMVEAAADDRGGLRHLFHRLQPIEPRHQRVVQRRWDRQRAQRAVEVIRVRALAQHARFDDRLRHLLDEQGHAIGLRGDLVDQRLGQALAVGDAGDDRLGRRATKPVQCQPRDDRMAPEGRDKGRACGDQHEHTRALDAIQREFDQLQRRRIDPMRVLDHPQHRLTAGKPCQLVDEDGKRAVAALLRGQGERAVARSSLEPNERRHQRGNLADIAGGLGQQRLQPVQAALRRVVLGKAGGVSDLLDRGVERAVDMIGRTLVAQQKMRFAAQLHRPGLR